MNFWFYWFESSPFWWVWLAVCQFYLFRKPVFSFIDLCYCLLHLFLLWFFMISFLLLTLEFFFCCCSSFSNCFRCKISLFIWYCLFLEVCLYCYKLPSYHCFYCVQYIWVVMFSPSFASIHILICFLTSSVTCWLFRKVLFSLHVLVFFFVVVFNRFFSWCCYLILWCCGQKRWLELFQFLKIYHDLICVPRCDLCWRMFHVQLRKSDIYWFWMKCL